MGLGGGLLAGARRICVVEDGTAGGSWGETVAQAVHRALWGALTAPVLTVHAAQLPIPAAGHLEREVLVQQTTIHSAVLEASR